MRRQQRETRKTHQAKKRFRHLPSPLFFFCAFLCVVLFLFTSLVCFLSTECARAFSLSAESIPTPIQHTVDWVVNFVGKNT